MNGKTTKRLFDMEIDEVSLVDRPANQHASIAISKAFEEESDMVFDADGNAVDVDVLEHGDVVYNEVGEEFVFVEDGAEDDGIEKNALGSFYRGARNLPRAEGDGTKAFLRGQSARTYAKNPGFAVREGKRGVGRRYRNAPTSSTTETFDPKAGIDNVQTAISPGTLKGGLIARDAGIATVGVGAGAGGGYYANKKRKEMSKSDSLGDLVMQELSKAASEDERNETVAVLADELEIAKAAAAEAWEMAESERDLRLTEEFISKAAEYNVPVSPVVLGPILKSMAETLTDEQLEVIDTLLTSVGDMLFDEIGFTGENDNVSVIDQVNAYANEYVGKSDVSGAQAITDIFAANPEAYEAYLQEGR